MLGTDSINRNATIINLNLLNFKIYRDDLDFRLKRMDNSYFIK